MCNDEQVTTPTHYAWLQPSAATWVVERDGREIARSDKVVLLHETYGDRTAEPVAYFPPDAVPSDILQPAELQTHCPIKGDAGYHTVVLDGEELENGIWFYPEPVEDAAGIAARLAFDSSQFDVRRVGPISVVEETMLAWANHDIEGVLEHVADDVEWHYHVGSMPVHGKEAMGKFLARLASHQLDSRWRIRRAVIKDEGDRTAVLLEGVDDFATPEGDRVVVPYMGVYELVDDRIVAWRDYVDLDLLTKTQSGEPVPGWVAKLTDS